MKKIITIIFFALISISLCAENTPYGNPSHKSKSKFIKSLMEQMTLREMVGQLIMIDSYSKDDSNYYKNIVKQLDSNYIGGVCFFKGTSKELLKLNSIYNSHSKIPLFVAIDGEWGLNMRLTDIETYPLSMTLGALPQSKYSLVYDMGRNIAKQCKSLGININFAPDVDINLNPDNPVINMRSFGQDKYKVALLAEQYVKGLQDENIMAVIKHFPGHGDTETDSHKATPLIKHNKAFIDSVDSYPFRYNIKKGAWAVMVGHLQIDALSKDTLAPASINKDIIEDYLLDDLDFDGLVFTDAMNMKGLTTRFSQGEAEVRALEAGVDIILMPDNTDKAIEAIISAVESGRLSKKLIKEKCKKVLSRKYDMGLFKDRGKYSLPQSTLFTQQKKINKSLAENTITLVNNKGNVIPFDRYRDSITLITVGNANYDTLIKGMQQYCNLSVVNIKSNTKNNERDSIIKNISKNQKLVTAIGGGRFATGKTNYGIPDGSIRLLEQIKKQRNDDNVVLFFANPYVFKLLDSSYSAQSIIVAYENNAYTQTAAYQLLFGEIYSKGSLPVTVNRTHFTGTEQVESEEEKLYKFCMDNSIDIKTVKLIDSIAENGIKEKAYPGCQLLVARDGKILLDKAYGYYTYDKTTPVTQTTMYDIASLTKVMATTIAVMKLYERDRIELDAKISTYIPELKKSKVGNLTVKELLSHYTTLPATYPFWKKDTKNKRSKAFMLEEFKKMNTDKKKKYVYSDLNFLLLQFMVENVSGMSLDEYVKKNFYDKMNLTHTTFKPLDNGFAKQNIAPTEYDTVIRKEQIQGEVHDPMAYYIGGVCGNAGLFSTAEDLFKICQMLLNNGVYDGNRYIDSSVVALFNKRYFENVGVRRALGFDKPFISDQSTHCSKYASQKSFGHSGFTGTYLWIEPENKTVFIFLSNRVYPSATPNRLAKMNIRTDINDLIYKL